jgi:hypothetical protein
MTGVNENYSKCQVHLLLNFSHKEQESTVTNTAKLSKKFAKPLNEGEQDD